MLNVIKLKKDDLINNFYIYNYKKIKEANLGFNNINIIIGKNNSGKSSLLSAIHFFFTIIYSIKDNINNRGNIAKIKRLEFPKENTDDINEYIQINVNIENKTIPIHQMGIGFLQLLHILSYKHYFKSKILILDEPEMHLHAKLCHKLLDLLENWSRDYNMQIFVSTHSYNSIKYIISIIEVNIIFIIL